MGDGRIASMRLHIRSRPGMYIGGLNARGVRHMLDDLVGEMLDEPGAEPERVTCRLGSGGDYEVEIAGGGCPAIDRADFDPARYDHEGCNDRLFSLVIVSAMSDPLEVEIVTGGRRHRAAFRAGLPTDDSAVPTTTATASIRIRYRPDPELFRPGAETGFLSVCGRAREWAAFHPATRFSIHDAATAQRRDYWYPDGLRSFLSESAHGSFPGVYSDRLRAYRCVASEPDGSSAEVVLDARYGYSEDVSSYVNGTRTYDGGSHVEGVRDGLNAVAKAIGKKTLIPYQWGRLRRDLINYFTVLVAVRLDKPEYEGATRDRLGDDRARQLVARLLAEKLPAEVERVRQQEGMGGRSD